VGAVISSQVRRSDTVARLGGDEFALIFENCTDERIGALAERIWQALNPLETKCENATHLTGASVGVAIASERFQNEFAWLAAADRACYDAKRAGRGRLYTTRSASFDDQRKGGADSAR
jgi:diguanylate cyclase (GGDEF)-like protein